jgi:hypothetical protein
MPTVSFKTDIVSCFIWNQSHVFGFLKEFVGLKEPVFLSAMPFFLGKLSLRYHKAPKVA